MDLRNEITQIVYVSALEEYAIQLFQNRPMDFLIKPIKQEDIDKIMNNYIHVFGKKEKHVFEYRVGKNNNIKRNCFSFCIFLQVLLHLTSKCNIVITYTHFIHLCASQYILFFFCFKYILSDIFNLFNNKSHPCNKAQMAFSYSSYGDNCPTDNPLCS